MCTNENRARYERSRLRYPSGLTGAEWAHVPAGGAAESGVWMWIAPQARPASPRLASGAGRRFAAEGVDGLPEP